MRIADVAGVDLRWLLTGESAGPAVPADHPAVQRIVGVLAGHPDAAEPLAAFVDLLAQSMSWPKRPAVADAPAEAGADAPAREPPKTPAPTRPRREWIPVLGRSAAGVPHFWADAEDGRGLTVLADLVRRHARRAARHVRQAVATDEADAQARTAQIITLTAPDSDNVAEFLVAGTLKQRYPDAFAVRIDGASMSPEINPGDLVVCSPASPAAAGRAAVVQLEGQIGVTCKVYRSEGGQVHLVPVNEQFSPQSFPAGKVLWALRVLARVTPE